MIEKIFEESTDAPEAATVRFSLSSARVTGALFKVLRALQLDKSVLLEGMPGVGKSSLIEFLAFKRGIRLLKISLNEQTDIVDLLGSDLPAKQEGHDNT